MIEIGSRMKMQREKLGYSQQVVSDYLGMSQSNYHNIESDKVQPKLEHLEKLASFFKVSLFDLISIEKSAVNIQNNTQNHNGIVIGDAELFHLLLKAKEEIIGLKDELIASLKIEIQNLRKS
ncbi:MAG: helix-turn-helix domain-containing protein [Flammeovirgaceae bacterium]